VLLFSQNKLSITILNQKKEPVSRVIVLVSQEEQQVAFGLPILMVYLLKAAFWYLYNNA
jgi:hypothetical protein